MRFLKSIFAAVLVAVLLCGLSDAQTVNVDKYGTATPKIYDYTSGAIGSYYLDVPTLSANDTFCGLTTTQTLTNKTLTSPTVTSPTMTGVKATDYVSTPKIYDYSGGVGTYYLDVPTLSANDTFCGLATTQTLTNKTLTTPTITNPTVTTGTFTNPSIDNGTLTTPKITLNVVTTTDNMTLATATHNGAIITNKGAQGNVRLTAMASPITGFNFTMACMADQVIKFDPKPDNASIYVKGAAQAAGSVVSVTDIGDFIQFVFDGTDWLAFTSISGADGDITVGD